MSREVKQLEIWGFDSNKKQRSEEPVPKKRNIRFHRLKCENIPFAHRTFLEQELVPFQMFYKMPKELHFVEVKQVPARKNFTFPMIGLELQFQAASLKGKEVLFDICCLPCSTESKKQITQKE